jgi:hypothetical protein
MVGMFAGTAVGTVSTGTKVDETTGGLLGDTVETFVGVMV